MLQYRPYYHRHLPHYQPPGCTLFVTFRLAGFLSKAILDSLLAQQRVTERVLERIADPNERDRVAYAEHRRLFGAWDDALDAESAGPRWLEDAGVADLVADCRYHRDGRTYNLHAFCIMPNHVHLVCTPLEEREGEFHSLAAILHSLKLYTAREANKLLGRRGSFWQHESYDHVVRDGDEFSRIVTYVLNNPVKAGLTVMWEDWRWAYSSE
ncbi:transposase [Chloroflexota bacterium]